MIRGAQKGDRVKFNSIKVETSWTGDKPDQRLEYNVNTLLGNSGTVVGKRIGKRAGYQVLLDPPNYGLIWVKASELDRLPPKDDKMIDPFYGDAAVEIVRVATKDPGAPTTIQVIVMVNDLPMPGEKDVYLNHILDASGTVIARSLLRACDWRVINEIQDVLESAQSTSI